MCIYMCMCRCKVMCVLQASNALGVLCQTEDSKEVAKDMFSKIFSALMLRIGISVMIDSSKKPLCVRYICINVHICCRCCHT